MTGNVSLAAHTGTVRGALGLTDNDVAAVLADAGTSLDAAPLNLATVSLLHRYAVLARRLKVTVSELITLRQLAGVDPFAAPPPGPITEAADDHTAVTIDFTGTVAADIDVTDLDYLLRHRFDPEGPYALVAEPPLELIRALDGEITRIGAEHPDPADPTALGDDELHQKIALVLPAADTVFTMWTGTIAYDAVLTGITPGEALDPGCSRRPTLDHADLRPALEKAHFTQQETTTDVEEASIDAAKKTPTAAAGHQLTPEEAAELDKLAGAQDKQDSLWSKIPVLGVNVSPWGVGISSSYGRSNIAQFFAANASADRADAGELTFEGGQSARGRWVRSAGAGLDAAEHHRRRGDERDPQAAAGGADPRGHGAP